MNREIKFRAWDGEKMLYEVGSDAWGNPMIYEKNVDIGPVNIDMWVAYEGPVQQYTGKKAQNDKEIYEGDINQHKGKVIWNQDSASFDWEYPSGDIHPMAEEEEWCEIIGNIYEHPTLLEPNPTV